MKRTKIKNIIWDWNGTLLNDIAICIDAMNRLLSERNLPSINEQKYREVFTFPVKEYYKAIGFNFDIEPFDIPALAFIEYYHMKLNEAQLFENTRDVLNDFKLKDYSQFILSAMEQESLLKSVKQLKIDKYFNEIVGIDNHFAKSKVHRGVELIKSSNLNANETIIIGDTLHDVEVAEALGVESLLVSQGHQNIARLKVNGNKVVANLTELRYLL